MGSLLSENIEAEIQDALLSSGKPAQVGELIERRLANNTELPLEEVIGYTSFLVNAGQFSRFFRVIEDRIKNNLDLPWSQLLYAIKHANISLTPDLAELLWVGAAEQNLLEQLLQSNALDAVSARARHFREKRLQSLIDLQAERRRFLLEKLAYSRSQRMSREEKDVLLQLMEMFPEELAFRDEWMAFEQRWAEETIEGRLPNKLDRSIDYSLPPLTAEEEAIKTIIVRELSQFCQEQPAFKYDCAVILYFMDLFEEALPFCQDTQLPQAGAPVATGAHARDWLRLELLLLSRRFLDALDWSNQLSIRYADNVNTPVATMYARARAVWGLHQFSSAVETLAEVVNVRPDYRSAQSLLMQWKEQVS